MSPWERGCHNPALQNTPRRLEIAPNFSLLSRSCLQLLQKVTTGQESVTQFRCCNFCQGLARPSASPTSPRLFLPGHGFAKAPQNPQQLNTSASPSRPLSDLNCQHRFPSVYIMCFEKSREDSNSDFNFSLFLFEQIRADFSPVLLTPAPCICRSRHEQAALDARSGCPRGALVCRAVSPCPHQGVHVLLSQGPSPLSRAKVQEMPLMFPVRGGCGWHWGGYGGHPAWAEQLVGGSCVFCRDRCEFP